MWIVDLFGYGDCQSQHTLAAVTLELVNKAMMIGGII
jgi:hypothetical protein